MEYEEPLAQAEGDFIAEVIDAATRFCVGRRALTLKVFGRAVEDLDNGGAGGLDCVGAMEGKWEASSDCRVREEWSQRGWFHN